MGLVQPQKNEVTFKLSVIGVPTELKIIFILAFVKMGLYARRYTRSAELTLIDFLFRIVCRMAVFKCYLPLVSKSNPMK